ncbi:hypothetical protein [Roseibium sediminis]|uniref:hypothetical protein n=1 Tax=Roseibium sediminis TaxID=1775174 RepID=UPI00123C98F3|nr:hypothetical protein [Roseibium sediminis]
MSKKAILLKEKDLPWNQRLAIRLMAESKGRATGNWGRTLKCIPAEALSWKNSVKQLFTRPGRAANYQRYKCGNFEGSVHEDRMKGKAAVADGLSPTASNPSRTGCLILEAKSSRHDKKNQSKGLYSLETNSGPALSKKNARKIIKRYPGPATAEGLKYLGATFAPTMATIQAEGGDTSLFEDYIPSAEDHSTSGIWALVRSSTMMQLDTRKNLALLDDF